MMKKLPLYNNNLVSISALDPVVTNHTVIKVNLDNLGEKMGHILTTDEKIAFANEVRAYVNDKGLPQYEPTERIDCWWTQTYLKDNCPALTKVALAALTIFHGPLVESTFSEMARILCKQTARMEIPMLNAIQTAKYEVKSRNTSAMNLFKRNNPKTDPVNILLCRNMRSAHMVYNNQMKKVEKNQGLKQKVLERAKSVKKSMSSAAVVKRAALVKSNKKVFKAHIEKRRKAPPSKKQKT